MFDQAGYYAATWNIGDLSKWNTSKVTDMKGMFNLVAVNADSWRTINLSSWDVSQVIFYDNFNVNSADKVIAPIFSN